MRDSHEVKRLDKTRRYRIGSVARTLTEWAAARGMVRETLRRRVQLQGMSMTTALATPVKPMKLDLRGQRFGQLIVVGEVEIRRPYGVPVRYWPCRCDCGALRTVRIGLLRDGRVRSCARCLQSWGQTFVVAGEPLTVRQMAERAGRSPDAIRYGLRCGLSPDEAMQRSVRPRVRLIAVGDTTRSLAAWARVLGVSRERARQLAAVGRLEARIAARLRPCRVQVAREDYDA